MAPPPRSQSQQALFAFFRYTATGTAIRAAADNLTGAAVIGLDVKRLYAISFGLGLACVGAAGSIMMALTDMTPMLAPSLTLLAFTIVVVGGLAPPGRRARQQAPLIGVAEAVASLVVSPAIEQHESQFRPAGAHSAAALRPRPGRKRPSREGAARSPHAARFSSSRAFPLRRRIARRALHR